MILCKILLCLLVLNSSVSQRSRVPSLGIVRSGNFLTSAILPGYSQSYLRRNNRGRVKRRRQGGPIFFNSKPDELFNPGRFNPSHDTTIDKRFNWPHSPVVANRVNPAIPVPNRYELLFPNDQIPASNTNGTGIQPLVNDTSLSEVSLADASRQDTTSQGSVPPAIGRKVFRTNEKPFCATEDNIPCENDDEYDQFMIDKMEEVLRKTQLNEILDNSIVSNLINDTSYVRQKEKGFDPNIITRFGDNTFVSESPACIATESIIYPRRAKSLADDWVFVVNQNMVKQGVRVEKCHREGSSCEMGGQLPPTIKTVCRQKFIYRKLLVLSSKGTDIQPESVLIPSCCVCYVQRLDDLEFVRSANRNRSSSTQKPPKPQSNETPSIPQTENNNIESPNAGSQPEVNPAEKETPKDRQITTAEEHLQDSIPITFTARRKQTVSQKIPEENKKTTGANNRTTLPVVFNRKMENVNEIIT